MTGPDYVGYEYKELTAPEDRISFYLDSYESFGWTVDGNVPQRKSLDQVTLSLKRNRHIINKAELTRLQRNFECCVGEIGALEHRKRSTATLVAIMIGLIGAAFMAGSVFAVTAQTPNYPLCTLLGVPGFLCWIIPPFLYRKMVERKTRQITPLIEKKQEEIYALCERGHNLLPKPE